MTVWLKLRGFRILTRNFRGGGGELDIAARRGRELLIVEVKTARSGTWDHLVGRLSIEQRRRIVGATQAYIGQSREAFQSVEFALACVTGRYIPRVRILRNAFRAEDVCVEFWNHQRF